MIRILVEGVAVGDDLKPSSFPIMGWDYADDEPTPRSIPECGINCVAFVPETALDICQRLSLEAIVHDPAITPARWDQPFRSADSIAALTALVKRVNGHPAVMGYHLKDEPGPDQFAELGKAVAEVRKLAPGKWPYINLTPGMGEGYDGFLDDFVKQCHPTILCEDNYPLGQDGRYSYVYWANLAQVRIAALRHRLPFWTNTLSVARMTYAEPTPASLRLQVLGALVYGDRGICYSKFISRELPILEAPILATGEAARSTRSSRRLRPGISCGRCLRCLSRS